MGGEQKREKKNLRTSTKVACICIVLAVAAIVVFVVYPVPLPLYGKAVAVVALIGVIAKLTERAIIDISDMWDAFDRWRFLRR